jgi:hypothetical protein
MGWLRGRERLALITIIVAGACLTGIALYSGDRYAFIYSGDASSHLVRARQYIDSDHTGIHNIGTAWLPLPHLLLLPFAAIDLLFYTGLAGVIPGIACLVGAALAVYGLIRRATGSNPVALLSALVLGLNPNVLYLSLIPMSEAAFLLFFSVAAYCLVRWMEDPAMLRWLGLCSAAVCCATLSRYETWPMPGGLVLISIYLVAKMRVLGGRRSRILVLLLSSASFLGIFAWLGWNYLEYGNPLQFARAIYDIGPGESREVLAGHPLAVLLLFGKTVLYMFGPVLLGLATAAIGWKRADFRRPLLYFFLLLPTIFTLISLEQGFAQMDRWWWNSRYVLPVALPLLLACSWALHHVWTVAARRSQKLAVVVGLFSFSLVQVAVPSVGVITFIDAAKGFFEQSIYATRVGERLGEVYQGGKIALLAGHGQGHRVMIPSGIPMNRFRLIDDRDSTDLQSMPWERNRYLVLCKDPAPEAQVLGKYWLRHLALLSTHYLVIAENPDYLLLERKADRLLYEALASAAP